MIYTHTIGRIGKDILNTQMRNGQKSASTTTNVIIPNGKVSLF